MGYEGEGRGEREGLRGKGEEGPLRLDNMKTPNVPTYTPKHMNTSTRAHMLTLP